MSDYKHLFMWESLLANELKSESQLLTDFGAANWAVSGGWIFSSWKVKEMLSKHFILIGGKIWLLHPFKLKEFFLPFLWE